MDEKARKQMRETFIKGNEVYAGQKANGTIARILADHTWSEKYGKVVERKGRYALLFQDIGGGGQVIAFAPEQLEKALSDLKQQGYEQLVGTKPTTMKKHWQMTRAEIVIKALKNLPDDKILSVQHWGRGTRAGRIWLSVKEIREQIGETTVGSIDESDIGPGKRYYDGWNHRKSIQQALTEGKKVPTIVLRDFPELIPTKVGRKSKPLPPDAQNIQTVPFDSQLFDCYGKPTGRGFRAYCRRQK